MKFKPTLSPINNNSHIWISNAGNNGKLLIDGFIRTSFDYKYKNYLLDNLQYEPPLYHDLIKLIYKNFENSVDIYGILIMAVNEPNFMVDCHNFDVEKDEYIASLLNIHGDATSKEANANVQWLKWNKKIKFVQWPCGVFNI